MESVIFNENKTIQLGSNKFTNVPIIWKHDDAPMLEVVNSINGLSELRSRIYDSDGTHIATQKGPRIFLTDEGKSADVQLRRLQDVTVLTHSGRTLMELKHIGAAAISAHVEMYTQSGSFVRLSENTPVEIFAPNSNALQINGLVMSGGDLTGFNVGIHTFSDGRLIIGEGGGSAVIDRLVI